MAAHNADLHGVVSVVSTGAGRWLHTMLTCMALFLLCQQGPGGVCTHVSRGREVPAHNADLHGVVSVVSTGAGRWLHTMLTCMALFLLCQQGPGGVCTHVSRGREVPAHNADLHGVVSVVSTGAGRWLHTMLTCMALFLSCQQGAGGGCTQC